MGIYRSNNSNDIRLSVEPNVSHKGVRFSVQYNSCTVSYDLIEALIGELEGLVSKHKAELAAKRYFVSGVSTSTALVYQGSKDNGWVAAFCGETRSTDAQAYANKKNAEL